MVKNEYEFYLQLYQKVGTPIKIDEEKWAQLKRNKEVEVHYHTIEQKYDVLIGNYIQFEEKLLAEALEYAIRSSEKMHDGISSLSISRMVINLLMSIGLYVEQTENRHIKELGLSSEKLDVIKKSLSKIKKSPSLKFIKELRNFSMHNDLPLHNFSFGGSWEQIKGEDEDKLGQFIVPMSNTERLRSDKHFKNSALENIPEKKGYIDLRHPIRVCMSDISKFHVELRKVFEKSFQEVKQLVTGTVDEYKSSTGSKYDYCYAFHEDESLYLSHKQYEKLDVFRRRNTGLGLLERRYIHNRIK